MIEEAEWCDPELSRTNRGGQARRAAQIHVPFRHSTRERGFGNEVYVTLIEPLR